MYYDYFICYFINSSSKNNLRYVFNVYFCLILLIAAGTTGNESFYSFSITAFVV